MRAAYSGPARWAPEPGGPRIANNRLLWQFEGPVEKGVFRPERTVRYTYYASGQVGHITVLDAGQETYKDLYLVYSTNETLWLAIWQEWEHPPQYNGWYWADQPEEDDVTDVWEFRYDSGRQRYLARRWDFYLEGGEYAAFDELSATWTDYLGGSAGVSPADPWPYVDYTVEEGTPPVIEEQMRYLAGFGVHAQEGVGQSPPAVRFLHGDLIRSTTLASDPWGTGSQPAISYTAFGEPVTPDGH